MSYASEVAADTPAAFYRMQEASGNIQDSSGNAQHATSTGGAGSVTYSQAGAIASDGASKSILFNDFHFEVPDSATLDLGDSLTIECWLKFSSAPTAQKYILTKQTNGYEIRHSATGAQSFHKSDVSDIVTAATVTPNDGAFHHLVLTKNGATVKQYLDAVDVTGVVTNDTIVDNASVLRIGGFVDGSRMVGYLSEVALYTTELTAARVAAHYSAAQSVGGATTSSMLLMGVG